MKHPKSKKTELWVDQFSIVAPHFSLLVSRSVSLVVFLLSAPPLFFLVHSFVLIITTSDLHCVCEDEKEKKKVKKTKSSREQWRFKKIKERRRRSGSSN